MAVLCVKSTGLHSGHVIPRYYVAEICPNGIILAFAEWSDLMPTGVDAIPMKPLYLSSPRNPTGFERCRVADQDMFDIKRRSVRGSSVSLTEAQLVRVVSQICPLAHTVASNTLLAVPARQVRRQWDAVSWTDGKKLLPQHVASDVDRLLERLIAASWNSQDGPPPRMWLIGGWLYGLTDSRDVDVALECSPSTAFALRRAVAFERLTSHHRLPGTGFQFRLACESCILDIFPALPSDTPHPLRGVAAWLPAGPRREIRVTVRSAELGAYAWPTLELVDTKVPLVLMSNAFRGAIAPYDELTCDVSNMTLRYTNGTVGDALIVADPWKHIRESARLRVYERDALWTGPSAVND